MAEKNFKVASGIDLPVNGELTFGSPMGSAKVLSNPALTNDLYWDGNSLATTSYVDNAVGNINVTQFIDSIAQGEPFTVSNGDLSLNYDINQGLKVGSNGLVVSITPSLEFSMLGDLQVNTSYVASAITSGNTLAGYNAVSYNQNVNGLLVQKQGQDLAGSGLLFDPLSEVLDINTGAGLKVVNDQVVPDTSIYGGLEVSAIDNGLAVKSGNGISVGQNGVEVNTSYVANAIAGTGLVYSGTLDVNTNYIATKEYVDGVATGLDIKNSVKYASTTNVTIGSLYAGATFDGQTLADQDRILIKDQANAYENGIYVVSMAGTTRATDADSWTELNKGSFVFVESGTNAGHGFVVTTANTGSTFGQQGADIIFTQFSDSGNYITSVNNNTFTVSNNELSLKYDSSNFDADSQIGLMINTDYVAYKIVDGTSITEAGGAISVNTEVVADAINGTGINYESGGTLAVNTAYVGNTLAGTALAYEPINGVLDVKTGAGITVSNNSLVPNLGLTGGLFVSPLDNGIAVSAGNGISVGQGGVEVNTSYLASQSAAFNTGSPAMPQFGLNYDVVAANIGPDLAGNGLAYSIVHDAINVNTGAGLKVVNDQVVPDTSIYGGLEVSAIDNGLAVKAGDGITVGQNGVAVDLSSVGPNLAGPGLTYSLTGELAVFVGDGLTVSNDQVSINRWDDSIAFSYGKVRVNTDFVANTIAGNGLVYEAPAIAGDPGKIALATNPTVAGNLTVTGNLTVSGNTTTLNTETLLVEDNLIVLNSSVTGTPSTNAGIEVERGTSANASLYFDESSDEWKASNGSTTVTIGDAVTAGDLAGQYMDVIQNQLTLKLSDLATPGSGLAENFAAGGLKVDVLQGSGLLVNATQGVHIDYGTVASQLVDKGGLITGAGLTTGGSGDTISVSTGDGLTIDQNSGKVKVSHDSTLVFDYAVEMLGVNPYGAKTHKDGSGVVDSYGAYTTTTMNYASPNSNTYATVGAVSTDADSFEATVTITAPGYGCVRTSKIVGVVNGGNLEYTEYAIVEHNPNTAMTDADVMVEYDQQLGYLIKAKATVGQGSLNIASDLKYMVVPN